MSAQYLSPTPLRVRVISPRMSRNTGSTTPMSGKATPKNTSRQVALSKRNKRVMLKLKTVSLLSRCSLLLIFLIALSCSIWIFGIMPWFILFQLWFTAICVIILISINSLFHIRTECTGKSSLKVWIIFIWF